MNETNSSGVIDPKFGWKPVEDPRDWPMAAALVAAPVVGYRYHVPGAVLDQGQRNACVGYSIKQWKQTSPVRNKGGLSGLEIYVRALKIDEFPGEADTGTSIRAGVKVVQEEGVVESYVWAQGASEVKAWVLTTGSVVIGSKIYEQMVHPVRESARTTQPSLDYYMIPAGNVLGGHAYLVMGYSSSRDSFRIMNSWGTGWADKGRAWIHFSDLDRLIRDGGDAVGIVEKRV